MNTEKTVYYEPVPASGASLLIIEKNCSPKTVDLSGDMTFGRQNSGKNCDITVLSKIVSRRHGEFITEGGHYYYLDNNSVNGTYINGSKLSLYNERGSMAYRLNDGDIIRIDRKNLSEPHPDSVLMIFSQSDASEGGWKTLNTEKYANITIGRGENNVIRLTDLSVSRNHAVLRRDENGWAIFDNESQNGVTLNRAPLNGSAAVHDHDVIGVGGVTLVLYGNMLIYNHPTENAGLLSAEISKMSAAFGRRLLLRDIKFRAESGDFVLVLSKEPHHSDDLFNALLGLQLRDSVLGQQLDGEITLGGRRISDDPKTVKNHVAFINPSLILRGGDTVGEAFSEYAEKMLDRKEFTGEERQLRAREIARRTGVESFSNVRISALSSPQRVILSAACRMLGTQKVFLSADPGGENDVSYAAHMTMVMREIANTGKISFLATSFPTDESSISDSPYTKVLILDTGEDGEGFCAFFGGVEEAKRRFGVQRLSELAGLVRHETIPPKEGTQ